MKCWLWGFLLLIHFSVHAGEKPHQYIFYQPWLSHQNVSASSWRGMGQDLRTQGYTHMIFQWSQYGQTKFWDRSENSILQRVIQATSPKALDFIFGLYLGDDYYAKLGESDRVLSKYLAHSRSLAIQNAREIMQQSPRGVAGWYLPEEIDDLNWRSPARQKILRAHLLALSSELKALAPQVPIYASVFFGGNTPPTKFGQQINALIKATGIVVLVQDGLGTGRMSASQTQRYLRNFTAQLPRQHWHGLLETFDTLRVGMVDYFCLTQPKALESRKELWLAATKKTPKAVFSINQLVPSQLNQLECAKAKNRVVDNRHESVLTL